MSNIMPLAAPQQSDRLEGLVNALSRTLPPNVVQLHQRPPGRRVGRPAEARRQDMHMTLQFAVRFYTALKSTLALVGLAAVAAIFTLGLHGEVALAPILAFATSAAPFSSSSTVTTAGTIQASA